MFPLTWGDNDKKIFGVVCIEDRAKEKRKADRNKS
jgi:hypothetical protein